MLLESLTASLSTAMTSCGDARWVDFCVVFIARL
jgi:hypothetical protein